MSISTNYSYRPVNEITQNGTLYNQSNVFRVGSSTRGALLGALPNSEITQVAGPLGTLNNPEIQQRMARGQMAPVAPQAYKDQSADTRTGLQSFFSAGARYREKDAYQQNHVSVSGVPGMVHMAVLDAGGQKLPYAPFSWGGRTYHTDADGKFTINTWDDKDTGAKRSQPQISASAVVVLKGVATPAREVVASKSKF